MACLSGPGGRLLRGGGPPRLGAARAEPLRRDGEARASDAAAVARDLGRLDVAWMLKGGMWGLGQTMGDMYSNKVFFFGEGEGLGFFPQFLFRLYIYKHTQIYIVYLQVFVWSF
jgi:hypothetical protein